ncbi:hypothetical protein SAMN05216302_10315 [Nitrosomonas aestuarii]|uniref:Uncharacterized protein n=1 Tax=Nitrosomonas aestuarii TaxID=52441 RepID=A0A1I4EUF8_9PROT|nr:hypothetical protein [Nitrosomonas aestuarii]SFL09338.1 hypothetical protein SAMN05216302_10315 [Nitrosomonas aestuarii]
MYGQTPDSIVDIPFTKWKWKEKRSSSNNPTHQIDQRCDSGQFEIKNDHLLSYEENLKWESVLVSEALQETRKRKAFAINASMILFPGLVAGFLAIIPTIEKLEGGQSYSQALALISSHSWITLVIISMFIGMANMIAIKYIAAYKAQANLFLRQLNCLRQARDSITYYKFVGRYPIHLKELIQPSAYYKVFGKHRKLYIGNEELRNRMEGSFSDSADKSLIGFLFITSLTLISAPFICLSIISIHNWDNLAIQDIPFLDSQANLITANMVLLIISIFIFIYGHWGNFKRLRTYYVNTEDSPDSGQKKTGEIEIFKPKVSDYISRFLVSILVFYWIYLGFQITEEVTVFSVIMTTLALTSWVLILICVNKVFFDSLNRIHKSIVYQLDLSDNNR